MITTDNNANRQPDAFAELEQGVHAALETYSNVHRGSGHNSIVSTNLYEQARDIVLEYLGLPGNRYVVIFCSPRRAAALGALLGPGKYQVVSSSDIGLPLGIRALAVKKRALPRGIPFQTGGGTTRIIAPDWAIWANAPDRFEAGTPAIINVIAFARALSLTRQHGKDIFKGPQTGKLSATDILYRDDMEKYTGQELLDALRQTLIGRSMKVPTTEGLKPYINFDNSASTPTFTPVWDAVRRTWRQSPQVQQEIIREVRPLVAGFLGAPLASYDVIYTSNTTEAINLAAENLSREDDKETETVLLTTILEHSSNDLPWRTATRYPLIRLSIDNEGFIDLNQMETLLRDYNQEYRYGKKRIRLMAVCGASNVLGVFNNLEEISRIVHKYGAQLLVDAAQMVAHRKINIEECGIDYLAFSAHKIYAPFGCGVLVARKGLLSFSPEEMELIRTSGEENTGGIAALGKAIVLLQRIGMDLIRKEEQALTGRILRGMAQVEGITVYGIRDPDSPTFARKGGVIVFAMKGLMSDSLARKLALEGGIGVRYGCHCAHILIKHLVGVSPSLEKFQRLMATLIPAIKFPGLARVSLGIGNSE
ncbi:MAG: aminotransferase class V-fold PLP-dependent enzyme [Bacteroidia bacterium]|nr:MAG: aminotransferase class V-fold PLP-dependent enzyme [Bacteroidia bacterium]